MKKLVIIVIVCFVVMLSGICYGAYTFLHWNDTVLGSWQTSETHNPLSMQINRDGTGTILRYPLTWSRRGDTLEIRTNLGEGSRSFLFSIDSSRDNEGKAWSLKGQNCSWEFK